MLTELEVDHSELNSLMQLAGVQGLHPPAPPSGPLMQNACPLPLLLLLLLVCCIWNQTLDGL